MWPRLEVAVSGANARRVKSLEPGATDSPRDKHQDEIALTRWRCGQQARPTELAHHAQHSAQMTMGRERRMFTALPG